VIETEHSFQIAAPLDEVWDYVRNIENWASSMPGYSSFELVDDQHSKWVLKVSMGALVRTVKLAVEITEQRKPDHIAFSLEGENDPVHGTGTFDAKANGLTETDVAFTLAITGSGAAAGTMEAISRPIVPRMARKVGDKLKEEIEGRSGTTSAAAVEVRVGPLKRFWLWLRGGRQRA